VHRLRYLYGRLRREVRWWFRRRETVEERNALALYLDAAWFGVLSGIAGTFVTVFAIRLGASTRAVGLLSSLPALINVFWLIPAARIIEHQRRRLPIILGTGFLQRLGYFFIALVPLLPPTYQVGALIGVITLLTFPAAMASIAFTSMMADIVPIERRARVVSVRNMLMSGVSTIAVLVGGKLLDLIVFPINYQVCFTVGFLVSLVSLYYLHRLQVPDAVTARRDARRPPPHRRMIRAIRLLGQQRAFVRFTLGAFIYHWGIYLPIPLYSIYRVRNLGASDTWIGLLSMTFTATTIIAYIYWGRMAGKKGNRTALVISSLGLALFPALTGLSPRLEPLLGVAVIGGAFSAGFNLSLFNTLLEVAPAEHRPSYVAIYTALINVTAFLGPILGSHLAELWGIRAGLFLGGAARVLGGLVLWFLLPR